MEEPHPYWNLPPSLFHPFPRSPLRLHRPVLQNGTIPVTIMRSMAIEACGGCRCSGKVIGEIERDKKFGVYNPLV